MPYMDGMNKASNLEQPAKSTRCVSSATAQADCVDVPRTQRSVMGCIRAAGSRAHCESP